MWESTSQLHHGRKIKQNACHKKQINLADMMSLYPESWGDAAESKINILSQKILVMYNWIE